MKVATAFLQWSAQPIAHQSPSRSQTLASGISSSSSSSSSRRRRCGRREVGSSLTSRFIPQRLDRSALFGTQRTTLHRSKSCDIRELSRTKSTNVQPIRRACSASLESFSDEEFSKKLLELALKFQVSDDEEDDKNTTVPTEPEINDVTMDNQDNQAINYNYRLINGVDEANPALDSVEPPWPEMAPSSSIERKANSIDLPVSLRMIKRKMQLEERLKEARELAYCSMKKAFSSMVFMIRELQSFTMQMRELLFYEDLQGILSRVQKEMHASFVWIFQQVFSQTPTLMVYVMILLANFTVYSLGANTALAMSPSPTIAATELSAIVEIPELNTGKFDSSLIKTFSASSSNGKTASIGGNNGGGGTTMPVSGGTDGGERFDGFDLFRTIVPDNGASDVSSSSPPGLQTSELGPSVSGKVSMEEEMSVWNSMVEEADRMQHLTSDEALDQEIRKRFVSPVEVKIEEDDYTDFTRTELLYQMGLAQEPNNPLLLANYAQFLYLVTHDYDRAEECFKRAVAVVPRDAEALNKYAAFLWRARNNTFAAEEIFLEAMSAEPNNSYYSANYAQFLWNTGGEDTCFPVNSPETRQEA